jgi:hypothetical protein
MTLKVVNGGESLALQYLVNKASPQDLVLRLYKNDKTPADTDVVGDYTEADFTGYAAITLAGASWTVSEGDPAEAEFAERTFESAADQAVQTIYGYYLTRATGGELVLAERFPTAQAIQNNGDRIQVTPTITAEDESD